jgi:hypothetical protein
MSDGRDPLRTTGAARGRPERWRGIPDLAGVAPERAADVYERARSRAQWAWTTWAAAGAVCAECAVIVIGFGRLRDALHLHWLVAELAWIPVLLAGTLIGGYTLEAITRPTLLRCVRAELGTHCAGCDYDLRATPDLPPPAVTRCPECGRKIPRNVHRRTISAPDSSGAQRPPEFRGP